VPNKKFYPEPHENDADPSDSKGGASGQKEHTNVWYILILPKCICTVEAYTIYLLSGVGNTRSSVI
jgi:hypothetical protein